ncbi:MAG: nucleotidyl transferase AbiEii/AbiGii toxin family protein [Nanoarchaeota archaeon]
MIPIMLRLKKGMHRDLAKAQDLIIDEMATILDSAVLHGGTAIWRCYRGNRFSEDIDVYISKDIKKINLFFKNLKKKGFVIEKEKIGDNSLFSSLRFNRTIIKFEAIFKRIKGILKEYETAEGNLITVYTLTPEDIINEKIDAYIKRQKIRDLYDIFFLLRYIEDKNKIKSKIIKLIDNFKKPIDEKELKILIFEGLIPNYDKMLEYIKKWEK